MGVAFAILAVRERVGWPWITAGSLTVFSGVLALWHVPESQRELAAGRFSGGAYRVQVGEGWFGAERDGRARWAWTANRGVLNVDTTVRQSTAVKLLLRMRAMSTRTLQIRAG